MLNKTKYLIILYLFNAIIFSQRIQLFTMAEDIFTSSNRFTVKNTKVIFWEDKVVLMTVPIKNLVEVRYAETSYSYIGKPFVFSGSVVLGILAGLGITGNLKILDFNLARRKEILSKLLLVDNYSSRMICQAINYEVELISQV